LVFNNNGDQISLHFILTIVSYFYNYKHYSRLIYVY